MKKISILLIMLLLLCTGCSAKTYKKGLFYMDTYIEIKLYDVDKSTSEKAFTKLDELYKEYDMLCDRYKEYDNVVNVYYLNNVLNNNETVEIDEKLYNIISYGLDAYKDTNGYINIAMGSVIDVWRKYKENNSVPPTYELMNENTGIGNIELNSNTYKKYNDIKIDLGSYAKGYVTELASKMLEDEGIKKYLINAGGNVVVGERYSANKYSVGLETPFDTSNIYKTINVENESIVTSGSYQRYYEVDGVIYNHIINPMTLFPDNYTKSVTIITNDSAKADVLSTYLFMLPVLDGLNIVNNMEDVEAIWYVDKDNIYYSDGFINYEQK